MLAEFDSVFAVRRFPPGRLYEACDEVEGAARALGRAELAMLAREARDEAMRYIALRARRMAQRLARGGGRTREFDRKVDGNFATMYAVLSREAADYADEPSGKRAQVVLETFFPRGLAPVTQVAFEEQVIVNEHLIERLVAEHGDALAMLGIEREVGRIRALLPGYRDSLKSEETVSPSALGEAYERMQVALMRVVGWIMGVVRDGDERARLMRPVRLQMEKLAAVHAARRRGQSVEDDVPVDSLDLDAEAQAAVEAAQMAEAAAAAAASDEVGGEVEVDEVMDGAMDEAIEPAAQQGGE